MTLGLRLTRSLCLCLWITVAASHSSADNSFSTPLVYRRNSQSIEITYTPLKSRSGVAHWQVDVGEPFQYASGSEHQKKVVMGSSISVCSQKAFLRDLDGSLTLFHHLHPNAQLDYIFIGTYTIRELWREIRNDLRVELSHLPGKKITMHNPKMDDLNEPPFATWTGPNRVLQKSETVAMTQHILLKHGLQVGSVQLSNSFWFKEALNGHTWSEISTLPDVGILIPGIIEFDLKPKHQ